MIALRHPLATRSVQVALGLLVTSVLLAVTAFGRAIQLEPMPSPAPDRRFALATRQVNPGTPMNVIAEAVAAAPFAPTRERGSVQPAGPVATEIHVPPQLVGTVLDAEGDSFVLVAMPGDPPKILRVGQTLSGHRLLSIEQGAAVFRRTIDGQRVTLRVPRSR